ncbi:OadG family protein [Desulfomonile tiedjei]|uniref:Oxaloacetate decarboxylase, gamma chain n=1 Tax=Desulfomonile tiedjei (strain ATCC 49306 / DSM 6799 / DCB-1) TaxID=706587 RepID=I4CBB3_DESTA|nr:OadG family protein [Desulfomonile tiedjei]AFM26854.1 Oxaloacetate decarboxylase, gamma chain [Desulfomonile tiedjei DSM 6799]
MSDWSFGISLTIVGVSGTFLTLGILIVVIELTKKIFPLPGSKKDSVGR